MNFTEQQLRAIRQPGNVVVSAGAGAGKTRTLVERCLRTILNGAPGEIERILVVTFTDAAAAEVRGRIRDELEARARNNPGDDRLHQEIARLDRALICTLHSFCSSLIREHFHELGLEPRVAVIEDVQAKILIEDVLSTLLNEHYSRSHPQAPEVLELLKSRFQGGAERLCQLARRAYTFAYTRPDPEGWFEREIAAWELGQGRDWEALYHRALENWCAEWLPFLKCLDRENTKAARCAGLMEKFCTNGDLSLLSQLADREWEYEGQTDRFRKPLEPLFKEAGFFAAIAEFRDVRSALHQDWECSRHTALTILRFARDFAARYAAAKMERGALDFNDLEQFALKLLWDPGTNQPTKIALECQARFNAVFVDEYQDINRAQDLILTAVSRPPERGNRFLVGDVKQSIYGFREANPHLFRQYFTRTDDWSPVFLQENFRSHERVLAAVNELFGWLMQSDFAGVRYDNTAELKFGEAEQRHRMGRETQALVELNVLALDRSSNGEEQDDHGTDESGISEAAELSRAENEALAVAQRLMAIKEDPAFSIYDEKSKESRRPGWGDMVILLRSVKKNAEVYAKVFHSEGIPLQASRDGFFNSAEVLDVCNVLHILDNPLQDLPLLGVLRSPMFAFTATELAQVRMSAPKVAFWHALRAKAKLQPTSPADIKVKRFLEYYDRWRDARRCWSLAQRLEMICSDTGYLEWLLTQPRGQQRWQNIQELIRLAGNFDAQKGESLYLFLRHIEQVQDATGDIEPPANAAQDGVRLLSVHKSKGLEFPIVVVADVGRKFLSWESSGQFILDDELGFCSTAYPDKPARHYPTLPLWLAGRRQKREMLAEEARILYVALTRAKNHLLLFGTTKVKRMEEQWPAWGVSVPQLRQICSAQSLLDWIGSYFATRCPQWVLREAGQIGNWSYNILRSVPDRREKASAMEARVVAEVDLESISKAISYVYPHIAATQEPAKTTVTALRRKSVDEETLVRAPVRPSQFGGGNRTGLATHLLLEHLDLQNISESALRKMAEELVGRGLLSSDDAGTIDFAGIVAFWDSSLGTELQQHRDALRRELPFAVRISPAKLDEFNIPRVSGVEDGEFIVVQGIADLVLILPREIWLIDFKTDRVGNDISETAQRYFPQIDLYAHALEQIYQRRVRRKILYFLSARAAIER